MILLNLNYIPRGIGLDLRDALDDLARKFVDRLRVRGVFAFEDHRLAAVSRLPTDEVKCDVTEKRDAELLSHLLGAAAGENTHLVRAMRADEVTHVLDHSGDIHLHLPEHL